MRDSRGEVEDLVMLLFVSVRTFVLSFELADIVASVVLLNCF